MSEVKSARELAESIEVCYHNPFIKCKDRPSEATKIVQSDRRAIIEKCKETLCDFCHDECMHTRTDCMWYEALDSVLSEIEKEE